MPSLADYFAKERYQPKYEFGTRVFGKWNKIPFAGTIYGDSVINEIEGPRLTIDLDLPIKFKDTVYTRIVDTHKNVKDIRLIKELAPEADRIAEASKTSRNGFDSRPARQVTKKVKK